MEISAGLENVFPKTHFLAITSSNVEIHAYNVAGYLDNIVF